MQVLQIDLTPYAVEVDNYFSYCLRDDVSGWYMRGQPHPVFRDGQMYFTAKGLISGIPIAKIEDVVDDVYNRNGDLLVNSFTMRQFGRLFTRTPVVNYASLEVVRTFVMRHFEAKIHYCVNETMHHSEMYRLFKPEYAYLVNPGMVGASTTAAMKQGGEVDTVLDHLAFALDNFIGEDRWNVYNFDIFNYSILITKGGDYRIEKFFELQQALAEAQAKLDQYVNAAPQRCFEVSEDIYREKFCTESTATAGPDQNGTGEAVQGPVYRKFAPSGR